MNKQNLDMDNIFSEEKYSDMIQKLFIRFPSFQKDGASAYKPGLTNMEIFDGLAGHSHRNYRIIHVAGTNGKGSVSNMLASCLAASGLKVGLYTSPHILDFRERMRIKDGDAPVRLIPKEDVWDFVVRWRETFDHLGLSFFEITTMMALCWFSSCGVDVVVLETGLGGRLDSTNIVVPDLSVITNIGLDHCDMLGHTLPEIAFEKAGIIKPGVPAVVGESNPQTDPVFERKVLYSNLQNPEFMGDRTKIMSLLTFADKTDSSLCDHIPALLEKMDLRGSYQAKNLRTLSACLDVFGKWKRPDDAVLDEAIACTAARMDFHGRWEKLCDDPYVICDIGHNGHGLDHNFRQLAAMLSGGEVSDLIMVYGAVADKDVESVLRMFPRNVDVVFTRASGKRALPAEELCRMYEAVCRETGRDAGRMRSRGTVIEAVRLALGLAASVKAAYPSARPLIYVGGSTYVVAEAVKAVSDGLLSE